MIRRKNILGIIGGYIGFYLFTISLGWNGICLESFSSTKVSVINIPPFLNAFSSIVSGVIVGWITQRWKCVIIVGILLTITWMWILTPLNYFIKYPQWYLLNLHLVIILSIIPFSIFGGYIGKNIDKWKTKEIIIGYIGFFWSSLITLLINLIILGLIILIKKSSLETFFLKHAFFDPEQFRFGFCALQFGFCALISGIIVGWISKEWKYTLIPGILVGSTLSFFVCFNLQAILMVCWSVIFSIFILSWFIFGGFLGEYLCKLKIQRQN